ncbi:MAG: cytochrome c biogenesis protein CcsA [Gemmataceae bacterium]
MMGESTEYLDDVEVRHVAWRARDLLAPVASLRLTVVLFALSMVLVFTGTLAQMDAGIWTVVAKYFRSLYVWIPLQTYVGFLRVFFGIQPSSPIPDAIGFPFPGGWSIGAALLVNLLAAHLVRFKLNWSRAGILLTHVGVVLLLVGELITGLFQVEAKMTIAAGETVSYTDVAQRWELAFTAASDGATRKDILIPHSRLQTGVRIKAAELPVDVEVAEFAKNSTIYVTESTDADTIQTQDGRRFGVRFQVDEAAGVDPEAGEDIPSARVRFFKKGTNEEIAAGLLSAWFDRNTTRRLNAQPMPPRSLDAEGQTWYVALRPKREYKPYSLRLIEFRHESYIGTDTPKNFSSLVHLSDAERGEDRDVLIYMNSPLRYEGETFFQAGYLPGDTGTILQVVRNPGWLLPYISCIVVAAGMVVHFGMRLVKFLDRQLGELPVSVEARLKSPAFWLAALSGLVFFALPGMPQREPAEAMHVTQFGELPIVHGGRIKPLDTFARNTLQLLSVRQELSIESGGKSETISAIRWLLDVWSDLDMFSSKAADYRVFRIENEDVLKFMELPVRPGSYRYSIKELQPQYEKLQHEFAKLRRLDEKKLNLFQSKLLDLARRVDAYEDVARLRSPLVIPPQDADSDEWLSIGQVMVGIRQIVAQEGGKFNETLFQRIGPLGHAALGFVRIMERYRTGDAKGFNEALDDFRSKYHRQITDSEYKKVNFETFFNRLAPFYYCAWLYVGLFVVTCVSWLWPHGTLSRASLGLGMFIFLAHIFAIIARMYIQGRPPVTNLYSSAVFIGCVSVGVLLLMEWFYRNGVPTAVAAVLGASTLLVAHYLGVGGDTLEMMRAVLDTNFWLATHVVAVTAGYAATFVAGFIAIVYLVTRLIKLHDRELLKPLADMVYGVVCFATLLSFVGTVLGGIWADQSWGRFWGWDPKENGAVLIVVWNALILHARWGGLVKARGMAVLAVLGNVVTAWSWFGTNQLGVGLHSYGFTSGVATALVTFDGAMFLVAALGLVPTPKHISHVPPHTPKMPGHPPVVVS